MELESCRFFSEVKMKHNTKFIQDFMARYEYSEESVSLFTKVLDDLDNDKAFGCAFDMLKEEFDRHRCEIGGALCDKLSELAKSKGYSEYTLHFVFLLCLTEDLKNQYGLHNIDPKIYYRTMDDLRCKLNECLECEEVPGTFVAGWFSGFFRMDRVGYGRFQYEVNTFDRDKPFTMNCGHIINPGDIYINFHIPNSGIPLTDEIRYASYKEAYDHVKGLFPDGKVIFGVSSWLLFPKQNEFLPKEMNILKFLNDFEIVDWAESDRFGDGWRVFGKDSDLPVEQLPEKTKLQKAYKSWILSGNKTGHGFGLFMFDGEKIVK